MDTNKGFQFDFGSDESRWQQLLNEIDDENVIPVIGPDLLVEPKLIKEKSGDDEFVRSENLHQQLISYIATNTGVTSRPRTFSQLVYDENYKKIVRNNPNQIYFLIYQMLSKINQIKEIDDKPSQLLIDLLGTKKFPFVITTSFTPIVENVMERFYGKVDVLNFNSNPQESSQEKGGDIKGLNDLKQPTVYYMFGKFCNMADRFVVTDSDMMKFCSKWIKGEGVPKNLTEALKKKYLLILGNNYSDWLFRFVWYGLRSTTNEMKSDIVVNDRAEDSFKEFLERLETFFQEDPSKVIKSIKDDMEARNIANTLRTDYDTDVFISYSRSDETIAEKLYERLKSAELNVWFDNGNDDENGHIKKAENWKDAIERGLRHTRLFLPILTKNVENESLVPHEYREEWKIASTFASKMGGRTFIVPFVEKGFDFYNQLTKIPEEFSKKNATWFSDDTELDEITEVILREVANLKVLESRMKH